MGLAYINRPKQFTILGNVSSTNDYSYQYDQMISIAVSHRQLLGEKPVLHE